MPDNSDPIDALLRRYATERKAFAAQVPKLHLAEIRLLAAEARNTWESRSSAGPGRLDWLNHLRSMLFPAPWHLAAVAAVVLLVAGLATRPGTPVYRNAQFAMAADGYRGEPEIPAGFDQFKLDLDLNKKAVTLKFANGSVLTGALENEPGKPTPGEPAGYAVKASDTNAQAVPLSFRGVLTAVFDSTSPEQIKEITLRGILTSGIREYPITANVNQ